MKGNSLKVPIYEKVKSVGLCRVGNLKISNIVLGFFTLFFFILSLKISQQTGEQQFVSLAGSFLKGKLYFTDQLVSWADTTFFQGRYYWPLGPFPAIVLIPFILITRLTGFNLVQGCVSLVMVTIIFFWVYRLGGKYKFKSDDSLYLAYAFCFSSAFLPLVLLSWSWHFSQVVTVFLLWWSIWEYLGKKRYWLIGFVIGMAVLTRLTTAVWVVFFGLSILFEDRSTKDNKARQVLSLLLPVMIGFMLMGGYNFVRFGNVFSQGYGSQAIWYPPLIKAREYGLLSLAHVPGNIYHFLFATPLPVLDQVGSPILRFPYLKADPWGMSLFVTSPYLLYLFRAKYHDRLSKKILFTVFLAMIPMFLYYGIGWRQVGYRYALDFFPLIFWLYVVKKAEKAPFVSSGLKWFIILSSLVNLFFFYTVFG